MSIVLFMRLIFPQIGVNCILYKFLCPNTNIFLFQFLPLSILNFWKKLILIVMLSFERQKRCKTFSKPRTKKRFNQHIYVYTETEYKNSEPNLPSFTTIFFLFQTSRYQIIFQAYIWKQRQNFMAVLVEKVRSKGQQNVKIFQ